MVGGGGGRQQQVCWQQVQGTPLGQRYTFAKVLTKITNYTHLSLFFILLL